MKRSVLRKAHFASLSPFSANIRARIFAVLCCWISTSARPSSELPRLFGAAATTALQEPPSLAALWLVVTSPVSSSMIRRRRQGCSVAGDRDDDDAPLNDSRGLHLGNQVESKKRHHAPTRSLPLKKGLLTDCLHTQHTHTGLP